MDGSATSDDSGAGLIVVSPEGNMHEHALKFGFKESNNEAEYEVFLASMHLCYALGVEHLRVFSGSELIVSQMNGEYEARNATMVAYLTKVKEKSLSFNKFEIEHVPPSKNQQPDALSRLARSLPDRHSKSI